MINQTKVFFAASEFLMTSLSCAVLQKKIYLIMNHQGGKLIYESCPAVCNVAGSPPFATWVDPIRCDGSQKPAEGAVGKEKGGTNVLHLHHSPTQTGREGQ